MKNNECPHCRRVFIPSELDGSCVYCRRRPDAPDLVIACDFDGCLCTDAWPRIGEPNAALILWLRDARLRGHHLVLTTCRTGERLREALEWIDAHCGLVNGEPLFEAVNENLGERIRRFGGDTRKISADLYIDDRAWTPHDALGRLPEELLARVHGVNMAPLQGAKT